MGSVINWHSPSVNKFNSVDLRARISVDTSLMSAKWEKGPAKAAIDNRPQKVTMEVLTLTMGDSLKKLNIKDENGLAKDTAPLLEAVKSTINHLEDTYGSPVADMAIGMLKQAVSKKGAGEDNLSDVFSKLLTTVSNDESLLDRNRELSQKITGTMPEEGQWAGWGLLTLWNAGMNAGKDLDGKLKDGNGKDEYWGGEAGLALRNKTEKGLAAALADFFGSAIEQENEEAIFKSTKVFSVQNASNHPAAATIARETVKWAESQNPVASMEIFIDDVHETPREILKAIKNEDLLPEIEKAVKFLREEIGNKKAAHILEAKAVSFIDTALQVLQTVKDEQGAEAAQKLVSFFNETFVSAINEKAVYSDNIKKIYGALLFTGFSTDIDADVYDMKEATEPGESALDCLNEVTEESKPKLTSPFYANWGYKDPDSEQVRAAGYIGLGENHFYFNGGPGARKKEAAEALKSATETAAGNEGQRVDEPASAQAAGPANVEYNFAGYLAALKAAIIARGGDPVNLAGFRAVFVYQAAYGRAEAAIFSAKV